MMKYRPDSSVLFDAVKLINNKLFSLFNAGCCAALETQCDDSYRGINL